MIEAFRNWTPQRHTAPIGYRYSGSWAWDSAPPNPPAKNAHPCPLCSHRTFAYHRYDFSDQDRHTVVSAYTWNCEEHGEFVGETIETSTREWHQARKARTNRLTVFGEQDS